MKKDYRQEQEYHSSIGVITLNKYKDRRWKKTRESILNRDGYECQESKGKGITVTADTVHHIYPLEIYPELKYVDWNLISLSAKEHNKMHVRGSHELTTLGKRWQSRRRREFNDWLLNKNCLDHL